MNSVPTRLYRFQIEGPISRGVLSAVDESDQSSVQLLHVSLDGIDSGKKLEALEQIAAERACEYFTDGTEFYVVALSEADRTGLAGSIESQGLGEFTEPEAASIDVNHPGGDKGQPFPGRPEAPGQTPSRGLLLWGTVAALFLIGVGGAIFWLSKTEPKQAQPDPARVLNQPVKEQPPEQGKLETPPGNEPQPPVQPPKPPEKRFLGQVPPGTTSPVNGDRQRLRDPIPPVAPPPQQPPPQDPIQTGKAELPPGTSVVQNTQAALPIPPQPPKIRFTADSAQLKLGETTSLRWEVSGASAVQLEPNPGSVGQSGALMVRPTSRTTYTLHAVGEGGEASASVNISIAGIAGPASGQLIWEGNISGTQLVTIDHDRADVGTVQGALPRLPCIIQPTNEKKVGIVAAPSPINNYDRLVLRVVGKGPVRIVIDWAVQY